MTTPPRVPHGELARIPLLRDLDRIQLDKILALCEPADLRGHILFDEGAPAEAFYLLTSGSVTLSQDGEETLRLYPTVVIGEVGALTGRPRTARAVVDDGYEVWQLRVSALRELFARDTALALQFHHNLLAVVADKIHRDQVRLQDMRANIIHTQKDMKRLREFLLESTDTEVSARIHEVLENNIARNRRVNYRVEPPRVLAAVLRMDNGTEGRVAQISRNHVTIDRLVGERGDRLSGVLSLSGPEIPISGKIVNIDDCQTELELDLLLDEYAAELEGYLTRVQMLDYLV